MESVQQQEKILKALANRRRLAIVRYLARKERETVTDIANEISLSLLSTSKHLRILLAADVVDREQMNRYAQYALAKPRHKLVQAILAS